MCVCVSAFCLSGAIVPLLIDTHGKRRGLCAARDKRRVPFERQGARSFVRAGLTWPLFSDVHGVRHRMVDGLFEEYDWFNISMSPNECCTCSKMCTVGECAQLCKKQTGCHYFIVGNGKIGGVDKTGACRSERSLLAVIDFFFAYIHTHTHMYI